MTSDPDGALLAQYVRTHDPVAFDQIARRYRGMVFATARRVTRSHHDAEDVAQSCFLELSKKAASIRISIAAFLHSTATRRSIDLLRDQNRRRKHELKAAANRMEPEAGPANPERDWEEISPEVDHAIERLPDELKTLVILYFLRGLSVPDIMLETGLNKGMIERRLQVGVRRLRADLAKGHRYVSAGVLAAGLKATSSVAVPPTLTAATGRMAFAGAARAGPESSRFRNRFSRRISGRISGRFAGPGLKLLSFRWALPTLASLTTVAVICIASMKWFSQSHPTTPYDELNRMYAAYPPVGENSRLALHTTQIKSDTYSFWRGSQPLFYQWCKTHCDDWFDDHDAYLICAASPNLEDCGRLAQFLNTDESARLPLQIELLQGMILARVAAHSSTGIEPDSTVLAQSICRSYKDALIGDSAASSVASGSVASDSAASVSAATSEFLTSDLYVDANDNFRPLLFSRQGNLVAFLRPSPLDADELQPALAQAVSRNPRLLALCGTPQPKIRDIRSCVRHDAMITDGQLLLIVQLEGNHALLELKQQAAAPAELADAVQHDVRSPGQRSADDAAALSPTGASPISWCQMHNGSFTVAPLTLYPQVCELNHKHQPDALEAATLWARAAASTHSTDSRRQLLAARITPKLQLQLAARCDAYLQVLQSDLQQFNSDSRVATDRARVNQMAAAWSEQVRADNP